MKNKNIRNVPELRFPGFEGEWEKCKVRDIATTTIGEFVIKSKQNDSYPYPVYNGGRTNTGFYDKYNNEGNKILVSARGNAGFVNIIKTRYWAGNSCYSIDIIDKNKNNVDFTYYEMKLKENVFIKNQQSATIPSVSKSAVENFELLIPLIQEQTKIGSFLATIDALISETEKELEACREQKRGMLQKMFPKKGETVPEIRFPGFTDAWEQRKVYEIADRFDNLRVPVAANLRVAGDTPYYGANGIQDYVDGYTHDGEYVLVAEDGASDLKNYPVNYVNGRIWVNNHAHVLQGKNNIASNRFLSYAISLANIESVLVGGGRAKLNADVMMNLNIDLPTYKEQCRVAEYFSNLDNLITLHQRELDRLLELKKGFMQKMFC